VREIIRYKGGWGCLGEEEGEGACVAERETDEVFAVTGTQSCVYDAMAEQRDGVGKRRRGGCDVYCLRCKNKREGQDIEGGG
jgi:hypothetical protein